jgi:hypothetical protein
VVLTVRVEVPEPPATDAGLNAHVGPRVAAGATLHVKATAALKPFAGVIVEVADPPGATDAASVHKFFRRKIGWNATLPTAAAVRTALQSM